MSCRIAQKRKKEVLPFFAESRLLFMSLKFGLSLPQGWTMDLASIKDPVEAYETMTRVAQTADEVGFESAWLVDHFHTIPHPSEAAGVQEVILGFPDVLQLDSLRF